MDQNTVEAIVKEKNSSGLTTAIIGIGNAGSQVTMRAAKDGFNVIIMNTSKKDLDDDVVSSNINGLVIGDGGGTGKSRENAHKLLHMDGSEGIRKIFTNPYFISTVEPANVVFVCFSTGGGTGSGIAPEFASYLHKAYPTKVIIPYGILPKTTEDVKAQSNSIACVDALSNVGTPYMLADLNYYINDSQEVAYKKIGEHMTNTMRVIRGDYLKLSENGMTDERDILTVISEPGYMAIYTRHGITEPMLADKTLQKYLTEAAINSPTCRIQRDKMVAYSLMIANVNSFISDPLKAGDFSEYNGFIGEPQATYVNYSVDDTITEFDIIAISSGLTVPNDRVTSQKARVEAYNEQHQKNSAINLSAAVEATKFEANKETQGIIMGLGETKKADLSFLDSPQS